MHAMSIEVIVPARLWDYGFVWVCEAENVCANLSKYAVGRMPIEIITGDTPDISEYLDFKFYDWVMFRTNAGLGEAALGRWIGVSHRVGRLMSYGILPESGIKGISYNCSKGDESRVEHRRDESTHAGIRR
jgi:hypothetical protein